ALPAEALRLNNNLDFSIPNDSEFTFLELISNNFNPENILGLTYRKNGEIIRNEPQPVCQTLDDLGVPAHDLVPLKIYHDPFTRKRNMAVTYTSRGCINYPPCIMCSACFYNRVRYRSVKSIIEEFRWLKSMGVKELRFPFEAGFNHTRKAHELFDAMISEKLDLKFTCNGRADYLPVDLLKKMKQAGCMAINVGCESTNPQTLEFIHKSITKEQVKETVRNIKKAGMDVLVYFIYGLPFETMVSMKRTLSFAKEINADMVTFGIAIPHPGTDFYEYLKNNGYLLTEDWNKYDPMLPPPYSYPGLSSEDIFYLARKSYRSYYMRPSFIFKRFLKFNLIEEFENFIGFINRYVKSSR
ncbi:MAG: radical SAM protein, partial [Bacteroidota bacterium]